MFGRFGRKKQPSPRKGSNVEENANENVDQQAGFICPMCMESLPGPAELQTHFEKVHSDGPTTEKLIDVDGDETDALPESSSDDLLTPVFSTDYSKAKLELSLDPNAPDTEKEVVLLQQELAEMTAQLKEEKWYSSQLKLELDKVSKERDKLEEEKALGDEEYTSQLRSAEQSYLTLVEENMKLKDDLKFADYNTTKERHEKLKLEMIGYQNEAEEERLRRQALEESFNLLQNELYDGKIQATKIEEQLQARPSSDEITSLQIKLNDLTQENISLKTIHENEIKNLKEERKNETDDLTKKINSLEIKMKEVTLEKTSKEEQIASLQSALSMATDSTSTTKQQINEKSQQIIELQYRNNEIENDLKYKTEELLQINKEINELKMNLNTEINLKEQKQNEILNLNNKIDELKHHNDNYLSSIQTLETSLTKEKDEIIRLEKERIELIAKIEAGEGTDTVIQQLSQEKAKLLETVASFEKSISDTSNKHATELENMRQEKLSLKDEIQKLNLNQENNHTKIEELSNKLDEKERDLSELKEELKTKVTESFKIESEHAQKENQLNEKITEIERTNIQLASEKQSQETYVDKLKEDLLKTEKQSAQQQSWLETKNNAINEMTIKVTTLQEQLNNKNSELLGSNKNIEKLVSEVKTLKETLQTKEEIYTKEKKDLLSETKTCQDELKQNKEMLQNLEKNVEELEKDKKKLEDVEATLIEKNDELNQLLASTKQQWLNEVQIIKNENEAKLKEIEEKQDHLNKEHEKDISLKEKELLDVKELMKNTQINFEDEIKKRSKADEEVINWETKYKKLEGVLEQKDEILNTAQSKLEIAEKELQKPCDSCKNYEIQLCRLQEATKDQTGQVEQLKEQMTSVQNELKALKSAKNVLEKDQEEKVKQLEEKLKNESETVADLQKVQQSKEEENKKLMDDLEISKTENENIKKENDELQQDKERLEAEVATLIEKGNALQDEVIDVKASKEVLQDEHQKMKLGYEEKENTYINEKTKLEEELKEVEEKLLEEVQSHIDSKESASKLQTVLKEQCTELQNTVTREQKKYEELNKSKEEIQTTLKKEIEKFQEESKKLQKEITNRERRITEHEMKLQAIENENSDLKGDISVLEAQIQNSKEEKKALLDRILSTEDQHKKTKQKLSETNRKLDSALAGLQELGQENQNLQVQSTIKSNRQWEKDSDVTNCKKCDKQFTMTVRKHHCRNCGIIFCKDCSSFSAVLASSKKPVRVCESCSVELNNVRGTSVRRLSNSSMISETSTR